MRTLRRPGARALLATGRAAVALRAVLRSGAGMNRYPGAEWVPWRYTSPQGQTYWAGVCKPSAVVLHIMAGYATTARQWAGEAHYGASWHFTVAQDGTVMQHLELDDAGYQAGIPSTAPTPTWRLWRGHDQNVNWYTLGIEHEGFPGTPFTAQQSAASRDLCRWLANELGIAFDREHFPAHAEIDVVNRVNDFNTPELREAHYAYLFQQEDTMEPYRLALHSIAGGSFARMVQCYDVLNSAGFFAQDNASDGTANPIDGQDDLNDSEVRRWRLIALAASDKAQAAYQALGGK